ncbi:unnamed protein product [Gongylonema pulchrum]|uniref:Uncharacterized protein n=1 Tax=Gongylonema pulchrum TaxID=637853 RepID=A0A183DH59_9BILA|nr:unnamed protein product [Gongylonema pulchrum]
MKRIGPGQDGLATLRSGMSRQSCKFSPMLCGCGPRSDCQNASWTSEAAGYKTGSFSLLHFRLHLVFKCTTTSKRIFEAALTTATTMKTLPRGLFRAFLELKLAQQQRRTDAANSAPADHSETQRDFQQKRSRQPVRYAPDVFRVFDILNDRFR